MSAAFTMSRPVLPRVALGAAFALVGLLAGCGDEEPTAAPTGSSSPPGVASPDDGAVEDVQATVGELTIGDGFVREPASPSVAAAYLTIVNDGDTDDRLVSVTSDAARAVMLMTEVAGDGVGTMTGVDEVVVPAHGAFAFRPRAGHLMLDPLTTVPAVGDTVALTLTFDRAGAVDVELPVEPIGTSEHQGEQTG